VLTRLKTKLYFSECFVNYVHISTVFFGAQHAEAVTQMLAWLNEISSATHDFKWGTIALTRTTPFQGFQPPCCGGYSSKVESVVDRHRQNAASCTLHFV